MSSPEFWDYDSADKFIKAGRHKDERPTKDAWNTKVIRGGLDTIDLAVKQEDGTWKSLFTYIKGKPTVVDLDMSAASFVWEERLNRYVGASRLLRFVGSNLIGEGPILAGGDPSHVILAKGGLQSVDGLPGKLVSGAPLNLPLGFAILKKHYITPLVKGMSKELSDNQRIVRSNGWCNACTIQPNGLLLGDNMRDHEHTFAHIFTGELPGEMLGMAIKRTLGSYAFGEMVTVSPTETVITKSVSYDEKRIENVLRRYLEDQVR